MTYEKLIAAYDELTGAIKAHCSRVPFYINFEAPDFQTKRQIIALAESLGLRNDGHGTWRAWASYPKGSMLRLMYSESMGEEVYLHTTHCRTHPSDYKNVADIRNLLTVGCYRCSQKSALAC